MKHETAFNNAWVSVKKIFEKAFIKIGEPLSKFLTLFMNKAVPMIQHGLETISKWVTDNLTSERIDKWTTWMVNGVKLVSNILKEFALFLFNAVSYAILWVTIKIENLCKWWKNLSDTKKDVYKWGAIILGVMAVLGKPILNIINIISKLGSGIIKIVPLIKNLGFAAINGIGKLGVLLGPTGLAVVGVLAGLASVYFVAKKIADLVHKEQANTMEKDRIASETNRLINRVSGKKGENKVNAIEGLIGSNNFFSMEGNIREEEIARRARLNAGSNDKIFKHNVKVWTGELKKIQGSDEFVSALAKRRAQASQYKSEPAKVEKVNVDVKSSGDFDMSKMLDNLMGMNSKLTKLLDEAIKGNTPEFESL